MRNSTDTRKHNMSTIQLMKIRKHFTLIEMLVVISIIAILAALLLPALRNAQSHAVAMNCSGNQRQIYLLLSMYSEDNQGFWPFAYIDDANIWSINCLVQLLKPDLPATESSLRGTVFICPSGPQVASTLGALSTAYRSMGYAFNTNLPVFSPTDWQVNYHQYKKPFSIKHPSKVMTLIDSQAPMAEPYAPLMTYIDKVNPRHQSRPNVLYADGHASSLFFYDIPLDAANPQRNPFWRGW